MQIQRARLCMQCTCTNRGTPGSLLTASRADRKGEKGRIEY